MVLFDYNRAFWDNLFQLAWGMVYCMPLFGLLLIVMGEPVSDYLLIVP